MRAFVMRQGTARAVLLVWWTVGTQHDAEVAVGVGGWCDADRSPRRLGALLLRQQPTRSAFMVLDAELLGRGLRAIGVLNPRSHPEVFAMLDAAGAADMRLASWRLR
ncbi:MAG: hypothetical protein JNM69_23815 [Archangium sp.]|nr:hypothetical protein [Archangium sp.]